MVISASLQACGVGFPFAIPTSICRNNVTICSALYLLFGISSRPPREFSLTSAGTKRPGQVKRVLANQTFLLTLRQFRALYPEYDKVSDETVLRRIHALFWPQFEYEVFAKQIMENN